MPLDVAETLFDGLRICHPLPLMLTQLTPLILSTPIMWYIRNILGIFNIRGGVGFLFGGGDYKVPPGLGPGVYRSES